MASFCKNVTKQILNKKFWKSFVLRFRFRKVTIKFCLKMLPYGTYYLPMYYLAHDNVESFLLCRPWVFLDQLLIRCCMILYILFIFVSPYGWNWDTTALRWILWRNLCRNGKGREKTWKYVYNHHPVKSRKTGLFKYVKFNCLLWLFIIYYVSVRNTGCQVSDIFLFFDKCIYFPVFGQNPPIFPIFWSKCCRCQFLILVVHKIMPNKCHLNQVNNFTLVYPWFEKYGV